MPDVENGLVLKSRILELKVSAARFLGGVEARIVPHLRQPVSDGDALGDGFEVAEGQCILRLDPRFCLRRIGIFEATVGVGHLHAVVVVYLVCLYRYRILERTGGGGGLRARKYGEREREQRRSPYRTNSCHWQVGLG